jgi:cytochrome c oxidase assembly factor CtaG/polyferredoxin
MDPIATAAFSSWSLNAPLVCMLLALALTYFRGWRLLNAERPHKYTARRLLAFACGLATIFIALASPIDTFSGFLLEAHMIQHLLLIVVAPPLLWLGQPILPVLRGLPRWLFRDVLGPFFSWKELRHAGKVFVHPLIGWCSLALVIITWHFPWFYELALHSQHWHELEHACFFWSAMLFWWPVIGVWPSQAVWPRWAMIPYLVLADVVNTGLSAVLCFSDHVIYPTYQSVSRLWGISALSDQVTAGAIMWVPGSIAFLVPVVMLVMEVVESGRSREAKHRPAPRAIAPRKVARRPWDLLQVPFIGSVLRFRYFRRSIQTLMLLLAIAVVVDGFFGPQVAPMNLAGVLPWTYWRGLAVIALLAAGNLFCMACPFTLPRDLARNFVTPLFRWPRRLRAKWIAVALLITYLWAYEAFGFWNSPRSTAWVILGYFAAAFAIDSVFKGASFCKYVCPIGQFHFVHALVSPLEVKVREPAVCGSCTTYDCIRGNDRQRGCELNLFQPKKTGNLDCTFCLDCVQACPQQNVGIVGATPGKSIYKDTRGSGIGRLSQRPDVAALALLLAFGAFVNAAGMTGPVMMWMHHWHAKLRLSSMVPVVTVFYVLGLLIVPGILVAACGWASRYWGQLNLTPTGVICDFAPALIPVGFGMWLAHFSNHLLAGWSTIIPVVGRVLPATASVSGIAAFVPDWLPSMELIFLDAGLLFTLYMVWRVACRVVDGVRSSLPVLFPWALLGIALYSAGVWTVFQPMQMRGMMMP